MSDWMDNLCGAYSEAEIADRNKSSISNDPKGNVMRQYLEIGPVPANEECQQVGTPSYQHRIAQRECRVYKRQLERMFPDAEFGIKSFPHDFGSYSEVVVYGPHAYDVEGALPGEWDDQARFELAGTLSEQLNADLAAGLSSRYDKDNRLVTH